MSRLTGKKFLVTSRGDVHGGGTKDIAKLQGIIPELAFLLDYIGCCVGYGRDSTVGLGDVE